MGWFDGMKKIAFSLSGDERPFTHHRAEEVVVPLVSGGVACRSGLGSGPVDAGARLTEEGDVVIASPFSGRIVTPTVTPYPTGLRSVPAVRIEVDADDSATAFDPVANPEKAPVADLWARLKDSGLPSFVPGRSLESVFPVGGADEKTHTLVINAADQDLGLCSRIQTVRENAGDLGRAGALLQHMTGAARVRLAVVSGTESSLPKEELGSLEIAAVPADFPQSFDRVIKTRLAAEGVPAAEIRVLPVGLALAIYRLFSEGKLPDYVALTLVGRDGRKKNVTVRTGTSLGTVLDAFGLAVRDYDRVLMGGALNGYAQFSFETPVVPGIEGVTVLEGDAKTPPRPSPCTNCGACVDVCPARLQPNSMGRYCEYNRFEEAEGVEFCIECGLCSHVCPCYRPLKQWFVLAHEALAGSEE